MYTVYRMQGLALLWASRKTNSASRWQVVREAKQSQSSKR